MSLMGPITNVPYLPTPVPMGGNSSFLWNAPQYCGTPETPSLNLQHEMDMAARLADQLGKDRLYRHDWIQDPCFGQEPAVAMPQTPQTSERPSDMSMADMPLHHPTEDPIYMQKLYVDPHFQDTPIITNQQILGGFSVNQFVG